MSEYDLEIDRVLKKIAFYFGLPYEDLKKCIESGDYMYDSYISDKYSEEETNE